MACVLHGQNWHVSCWILLHRPGDVVRCAFCGVKVGRWEQRGDPFRDHRRWSPSCGFIKGFIVGNVPIGSDDQPGISSSSSSSLSQETSRSYNCVCVGRIWSWDQTRARIKVGRGTCNIMVPLSMWIWHHQKMFRICRQYDEPEPVDSSRHATHTWASSYTLG